MVKPLGKLLKDISVFAGATIMGDGKVALILDVHGIAQRASVVSEVREPVVNGKQRQGDKETRSQGDKEQSGTSASLSPCLLVSLSARRTAIPLSMVARLEEIPAEHIERADNREVVQYRGQIMPLLRLSKLLGAEGADDRAAPMQVVVLSEQGRGVGLVVDRILDIVETSLEVRRAKPKGGMATAVIQQRVTDLLDIQDIIRAADPSFFDTAAAVCTKGLV